MRRHIRLAEVLRDSLTDTIMRMRGAARKVFKKATGFPKGRPGFVIDHIVPLACGGRDLPSNMQWQTRAEARAKDKVERTACGR